jgi:hypothetical protein
MKTQLFNGEKEKATAYEADTASVSVSYQRAADQAAFELTCRRL